MNRPDKFMDVLAEIAIGVAILLFMSAILTAGMKVVRVLDDGVAAAPSAWGKK